MIDKDALRVLSDAGLADRIITFEEVTSTNDVAKNLVREGYRGTALITAELQTAGRGRLGRSWSSPAGTGIWMSYLVSGIEAERDASGIKGFGNISLYTLITGLATAESLREYSSEKGTELPCLIKWPNDIVVRGRKICGILTEFISDSGIGSLIIGIGINTGQESFPDELSVKGTSYFLETGYRPEREKIIEKIIRKIMQADRASDLSGIGHLIRPEIDIDRYCSLMVNLNKEVVLTSSNGDFPDNPYIARGITEQGDLVVEDRYGKRLKVTSGEVSVRGVLGYT